jgi:hypothetical protein
MSGGRPGPTENAGPRATASQRPRPVSIRNDHRGDPIGEDSLSRFFADYVQSGRSTTHLLMHPRAGLRAAIAIGRVPLVRAWTGSGPDAQTIRAALRRPLTLLVLRGVTAVLALPPTRAEYLAGRPKHALRQNLRTGEKLGLSSRVVDDAPERAALLRYANQYERLNPVLEFRNDSPENDDMLPLRLWIVTESPDGVPLLLAVVAVDGPVAVLRYYRTLSDDDAASAARYFTMPFLVDRLRELGATHLAETARPQWLPNGLRQFQRKVGFRLVRLRMEPPPC